MTEILYGPAQITPGGHHAPAFGAGVAVAKYADYRPLEGGNAVALR